jgi:hypothetical protein
MTAKPAVKNSDNASAFILSDEEMGSIASTRGRKAKDSEYLDLVKLAAATPTTFDKDGKVLTGEVHAVKLTETVKAAWVAPQIRKAGSQLNLGKRLTVLNREGTALSHAPLGFVAFWVKPEDATSESAPAAE